MPWHQEPMKDAISCDKPGGAAHKLRSQDFRMGKPGREMCIRDRFAKASVTGIDIRVRICDADDRFA